MKILIYTHEYPPFLGGLATTSSKLANGISGSAHEVTVLAPSYSSDDKNYDNDKNFETIRMSGITRNHGIPTPLKETAGMFALKSEISRQKPDLMITVTREAHAGAGMLENLPCKSITRVAGYEAVGYLSSQKLFNKLVAYPMRNYYKKVSKIVCPSKATKELFLEANILESKLTVIYNGVNQNLISQKPDKEVINSIKDKFGIQDNNKILLTVSRIVNGKGQDAVIRILPDILKKHPNTKYLIAGHGSHESYLRELAGNLGIQKNVIFAGAVANAEVINYYDLCDMFILPNKLIKKKENVEGLPNVIFEACARAKPVITGIPGGGKEIVDDGVSGFVVDGDDPKHIKNRILELLGDSKKTKGFGKKARAKVESGYTEKIMIDNYLKLIDSL
ncbi:MAG: glycosyltransferase family 4 protein [Candidatus Dadabacteria bacterium]|nr:glycosyltransferase family 4 protein [Candidatus Dadabacteria bacterium]NIS09905.1 glycosyltransferase family 4 protein [Candidatus Dadabacteria bacterium]NIV41734.1 glycosyltransferase [Candidatus Dadabacteria bacterium]NIX16330.1 glycosyltransferase [Candidatus Dadabacteria bacterium]NIY21151.1 glycosyltransferase [Candidatus Dadabacteria bacterium]